LNMGILFPERYIPGTLSESNIQLNNLT
jgi:hypothetical protein